MSKNSTKDKKPCKYCEKKFADLEKHENRCKEHPDRKAQSLKDRNEKNKLKRAHINKLGYIAQAKNYKKNPEKKIKRQKQQHDYNQISENKIRNNSIVYNTILKSVVKIVLKIFQNSNVLHDQITIQ